MTKNTKVIIVSGLVAVLLGYAVYATFTNKLSQESVTIIEDEAPQMGEILFEDLPDYKVMKTSGDQAETFEFSYKGKSLGKVELGKEWVVDSFLSYENGNEYFGFYYEDADSESKYYTGPSIIYRVNGATGTFERWADFPSSKYSVTDVSLAEDAFVYSNPNVSKKVFLKNVTTGEVKEFSVDEGFLDFGDAMLSEDASKIAFAAVKSEKEDDEPVVTFVESSINVIDVATGAISTYETNKEAGYYSLLGWEGDKVNYEYETDDSE